MNFKELKQGFSVYLLDKADMTYTIENVTSVSLPHIDAKLTANGMVVDVVTDKGTYCMIADSDIAYPYNKVITTDKQNILREIEAMKATSEQALSQVEHHKETVTKCNQLIADLDPTQREKQATEQRFSQIEKNQAEIMAMLKKLTE